MRAINYIAALPAELTNGFSLLFVNEEGKAWQKNYTKETTLVRSKILELPAIEIGEFTASLLTNKNLIAAAEQETGQTFNKENGHVSLLDEHNYQMVMAVTKLYIGAKNDPTICDEIGFFTNLETCFVTIMV